MTRETKREARETYQHTLDMALHPFSRQGVSSASLGEIAKAAGVTHSAICWHFRDKSDLFSKIWELSKSNINELGLEYQTEFPDDPLSALKGILIRALESTVIEEQRRLLMEIILRKYEFVGRVAVVQQTQCNLCLESYDRIGQTLKHRIEAKMLPADSMTRRTAIIMYDYISGLMENWLFIPRPFDPEKETRDHVAILLEVYPLCSTLRDPATDEQP